MTKAAEDIARSVYSYLYDAVGDMASDMTGPCSGFLDDKWAKRIKAARLKGVRDVQGWLADELANDPDTIADLIGDRIYEATNGDPVRYEMVLRILEKDTYQGMKRAVGRLRNLNNPQG